jgi:hypothetical protein
LEAHDDALSLQQDAGVETELLEKSCVQQHGGSEKMGHHGSGTDKDEFRLVERRRPRSPLRRTSEVAALYLGGCQPRYGQQDLSRFLRNQGFGGARCWKLSGDGPGALSSSFKIEVAKEKVEELQRLDYWREQGLRVRRFFNDSPSIRAPVAAVVPSNDP